MNKILISGLVLVVGLSGYSYYRYNEVSKNIDELVIKIDDAGKQLPAPLYQKHKLIRNTFVSNGEYVFGAKDEESGETVSMILNYTVNHGIFDMLLGSYPINATLKINENIGLKQEIGMVDENIAQVKGEYKNNGNIELNADFIPLEIRGMLNVSPVKVDFKLDNNKNKIIVSSVTKEIKFNKLGGVIADIENMYEFSIKNKLDFKGSSVIKKGTSPFGQFNDFTFSYGSEKNGENYKFYTNVDLKKLETPGASGEKEKVSALIMVDAKANAEIIERIDKKASEKIENYENINKDFEDLLKKGFEVSIPHFKLEKNTEYMNANLMLKLLPQDLEKPLDIKRNLNLKVNVDSKSQVSEMIKAQFVEYTQNQKPNELKLKIVYDKGHLTINDIEVSEEERQEVYNQLDEMSQID